MAKVSLNFRFLLEERQYGNIIIKDVSEDVSLTDVEALVQQLITRNTKLKGLGLVELVDCTKITQVEEKLSF